MGKPFLPPDHQELQDKTAEVDGSEGDDVADFAIVGVAVAEAVGGGGDVDDDDPEGGWLLEVVDGLNGYSSLVWAQGKLES